MLSYYFPISENGFIYSLDMVRFKFRISEENIYFISDTFKCVFGASVFNSFKPFTYRDLYTFKIGENSFSIGLCFWGGKKVENLNCFIQFNPNKVGYNSHFINILNFLHRYWYDVELVNFDIAIDIPCKRSLVYLKKDRRVHKRHSFDSSGENVTEYLGSDSEFGRCKLYNKTIESKLDYTLTRFEITSNKIDYDIFISQFPEVVFLKDLDMFDLVKLSKSDLVLLKLLSMSDDPIFYFKQLGKDKQKTLQPFVQDSASRVGISRDIFERIMCQINFFKNNEKFS